MSEPTGVNVRGRYLGEFVDGDEGTTHSILPGSGGVNVRARMIGAFVDQAEPLPQTRQEPLRSFAVHLHNEPVMTIRGHGLKRTPGNSGGQGGAEDFLGVFRIEGGKEVPVALFNARLVQEIVESEGPAPKAG